MKRIERAAAAALFLFCALALFDARGAATAKHFMVAAASPLAVDAGYAVLKQGGSALDAAIAVQMVLGLVEPESSGLGGGAFLLHWSQAEQKLRTYDGRESAPATAHPDRFLDRDAKPMDFAEAVVSGKSVGVPGLMRMLELAHRRHGRLPWAELFKHAIFAAEEGFPLTPRVHRLLERERFLREDPAAKRIYYGADGHARPVGTRIINPAYGATLRTLSQNGADSFYRGDIAADIVRAVRSHARPGDLSEADLANYRAIEREPVCGPYRRWKLCSMAPPSSGGIALLQILGILERAGFERAAPHSARAVHLYTEAARLAYADRARYVGDPDFVPVPVTRLLNDPYLNGRAGLISERSMGLAPPGDNEGGTSHISVVDAEGNAVSMTTTIESTFGSRIMVRGFLLNNELTDFDFRPGGPNQVEGGKRPRSSMSPTMVFRDGASLELVLGSPGGAWIINFVGKTLVARLDWGMGLQAAIDSPNFGSRNGPTEIERGSAYEALAGPLRERGHEIVLRDLTSGVHAIERVPQGWLGAADPRREGTARGD